MGVEWGKPPKADTPVSVVTKHPKGSPREAGNAGQRRSPRNNARASSGETDLRSGQFLFLMTAIDLNKTQPPKQGGAWLFLPQRGSRGFAAESSLVSALKSPNGESMTISIRAAGPIRRGTAVRGARRAREPAFCHGPSR